MKSLEECCFYAFVDTAYLHGRDPISLTEALCRGGADIIQLRAKNEDKSTVRAMAAAILPVAKKAGVWLVVNDYPDIVAEVRAPLCHLGQEDFFDAGLKPPKGVRLGLSSHSPMQAERAVAAAPAYIAVGPVFATPTKPGARPVTLDYVRWAAQNVRIPWFAIGGITLANIDEVLLAGATRVCVVSAILNASDITTACAQFKQRLLSRPVK
jgi:thiamine-phosphate pyrophosphorylase